MDANKNQNVNDILNSDKIIRLQEKGLYIITYLVNIYQVVSWSLGIIAIIMAGVKCLMVFSFEPIISTIERLIEIASANLYSVIIVTNIILVISVLQIIKLIKE
jgi:hypothetical protein